MTYAKPIEDCTTEEKIAEQLKWMTDTDRIAKAVEKFSQEHVDFTAEQDQITLDELYEALEEERRYRGLSLVKR